MWMDNLQEPGVFSMKVKGQAIFRLNYPIKLYKWYHTCQSWNGHTGEWQVWVDGHRIARGFHNSVSIVLFNLKKIAEYFQIK